MVSDHGLFSSDKGQKEAANGQDSWGVFQGCAGLWAAGCWLALRFHQLKVSTAAMDLGITDLVFLCDVNLKNLGLLTKTDWSVTYPFCC